jgi:Cu2+-exporting ATPase
VRLQGGAPVALRLGSARHCGVAAAPGDAHSGTRVYLAGPDGPIASFELVEALRPDAAAGLRELMDRHVQVSLLSGDEPARVARLARRVGIAHAQGACSPGDKLARLREMQAGGQRVAMVGDGLNDGPALARADVSIAMGQGAPLAQAKSDFIVPGGQVAAVPRILRVAGRTRRVVRQNLAWAAAYNVVCVPLAAVGLMPPWLAGLGMAASSLLVVANAARLARD